MGKPERIYTYYAHQNEKGVWIGRVAEDPRLKIPGKDESDALRKIQVLHREKVEDDRHIERITGGEL